MSAEEPAKKEEGEARARAFEREYKDSHPDGPYLPLAAKQKQEAEGLGTV